MDGTNEAAPLVVPVEAMSDRIEGAAVKSSYVNNAYTISGNITGGTPGTLGWVRAFPGLNSQKVSSQFVGDYRPTLGSGPTRSEERRVGKECRSRWSPYH